MHLQCVWVVFENIFQLRTWKNLYGHVHDFSVDYDNVNGDGILDIHKYLMKKHDMYLMKKSI